MRAEESTQRFDGFSIESNDLTQLTLGIGQDFEGLATLFREDDPAVLWMIETVIRKAHITPKCAWRSIGHKRPNPDLRAVRSERQV